MVTPGSTRPVDGPTAAQMGELITSMANIEKTIVSNLAAVRGRHVVVITASRPAVLLASFWRRTPGLDAARTPGLDAVITTNRTSPHCCEV